MAMSLSTTTFLIIVKIITSFSYESEHTGKNDQVHVEEKNGCVVHRLVGYRRFEGQNAWVVFALLYKMLRMYINFSSCH